VLTCCNKWVSRTQLLLSPIVFLDVSVILCAPQSFWSRLCGSDHPMLKTAPPTETTGSDITPELPLTSLHCLFQIHPNIQLNPRNIFFPSLLMYL
jgi:hypothetical protein